MSKKEIIGFLKNNKKNIEESFGIKIIALYGSMSRGDYTDKSDVDILYKNVGTTIFKLLDSIDFLTKKTGRKAELVSDKSMNPIVKITSEKELIYV